MTEIKNTGCNTTNVLMGRVVSLEQIAMENAAIDRCKTNYRITYKYDPDTLPRFIEEERFNKCEYNNEKEVAILQNAVKCLKAMYLGTEDTSILDEYVNDTLLTFDFVTGKMLFDEDAFQKDLNEYKNKQKALIAEHNKIVGSTTLLNAIENAKKLQQIKDKIAELQTTQPKKEDAKYNHPEIVKGSTSVKQALDRYKELCELGKKHEQEWEQYEIDYKRSHAKKLDISEDTFRVFKELYKANIFSSSIISTSSKLYDAIRYESVKDYNENSWKEVKFDARDEGRKFLNQKQLKLWSKYGGYVNKLYAPSNAVIVDEWMMYDHFNDTDLMWLNALKAFIKRVTALKRIEEQPTNVREQSK